MDLQHNFINRPIAQKLYSDLFTARKLDVEILRMDLLHPIISGNKYMKLLPWLQQAKEQGKTHIITKGGPWSNHVHAAAYVCWQKGLLFTAIIKAKEETDSTTLDDVRQWNGQLIYCNHDEYKDETHWQKLAGQQNAFYILMGGEGIEGVNGVTAFFNHLELPPYDYIICPIGTGTTYTGIASSLINYSVLLGINPGIQDPAFETLTSSLKEKSPSKTFEIINNPSLRKFGKWPEELPVKMNEWYNQWQLPMDIVYTAKMMWVFEDLVIGDYFKPDSRILLIHTGGLQGNRSLPNGLIDF